MDPNETYVWNSKPQKKAYLLPAFGGVPLALFSAIFLFIPKSPVDLEIFLLCVITELMCFPSLERAIEA